MDNTLQTSFIPKQTITTRPVTPASSGGIGLFTTLSFVILFLSLVLAGGTYLYQKYLLNHIYGACQQTSQTQPNTDQLGVSGGAERSCGLYLSLEDKKNSLDNQRLVRMERLDNKMKLATNILSSHLTLIPLFDFLSTSTLKTIRFTSFSTNNGDVKLSGVASGYEDIAVESNILNKMPEVSNSLFGGLNLDNNGNVVFQLSFHVDPSRLRYSAVAKTNEPI